MPGTVQVVDQDARRWDSQPVLSKPGNGFYFIFYQINFYYHCPVHKIVLVNIFLFFLRSGIQATTSFAHQRTLPTPSELLGPSSSRPL